jgi:hypothetical protein
VFVCVCMSAQKEVFSCTVEKQALFGNAMTVKPNPAVRTTVRLVSFESESRYILCSLHGYIKCRSNTHTSYLATLLKVGRVTEGVI